jgi:PAS domain S-box-containing protein
MRLSDSPEEDAAAAAGVKRAEFAHVALENLFDISPDAIFVTDAQGIIRAANPRAAELFGYSQSELIGQRIESLVPERFRTHHPAHRENYHAHPRARQMGAALNLFGLRKDGTEFPVDIMLKPLTTPEGMIVLSIVRDVTEQHEAQKLVRRKDLQLRSLLDGVRDYAIYLLDTEGHVTTWNPGAERAKQYKSDEIIGKHFSRFFTQEDIDRGRPAELLNLAAQRGRIEDEGWRVRKDGSRFWANVVLTAIRDETGELTGFAKVTRDFTDRKRAEEAVMLQLSQALLANMDVRKLLSAISASLQEVVPMDCATLGLHEEGSDSMMVQFLSVNEKQPSRGDVRVPLQGSPAGRAFLTREPICIDRIESSEFSQEGVQHLTSLGMQSGCWIPLVHRGQAIGALAVASRIEGSFGQKETEVLVQVADQVAMAVSNAMVFRQSIRGHCWRKRGIAPGTEAD